MVNALAAVAKNRLARGELTATLANYATALELNGKLLAIEPNNTLWQDFDVRIRCAYSEALLYASQPRRAHTELEAAARKLDALVRSDPKNLEWTITLRNSLEWNQAALAEAQGDPAGALVLLDRIAARLTGRSYDFDNRAQHSMRRKAALFAGDLHARGGRRAEAVKIWSEALGREEASILAQDSLDKATRFGILLRLGRTKQARAIGSELDRIGFRHPFFVRERANAARALR